MMSSRTQRSRTLRVSAAAVAGLLTLGLSACSSSGGGKASGSTSTAAATAESGGFATASQLAQKYSKSPASIGITTPIGKAIPKNKTIVLIGSGTEAGGTIYAYAGFKQAAAKLGWTVKEIDPQSPTPQLLQQALNQAIQLKPAGVVIAAIDNASVTQQLNTLKSDGIPVVSLYSPDAPGSGLVTAQLMDYTAQAKLTTAVADKALADMGKSGTVGMIGLQGYDVVQKYSAGFSNEVKRLCPTCKIKTMEVSLSALGTTAGTDIVNFVRSNPDIKSLFIGYDGMDSSLFSAATAAGVTLPKTYSSATLPTSIGNLASGQLTASAPIDYDELGWRTADAFARIFTGNASAAQTVDNEYPTPMIWSKSFSNVPATPSGSSFPSVVPNFQSQYEKLWGMG